MSSTGIRFAGAVVALVAGVLFAGAVDARATGAMAARLGAKRIATGPQADHTCFVVGDGSVRCWGSNSAGQLGVAGASGLTPVTPPGIINAVSIAVGQAHTCALGASGSVFCWGSNQNGQLGLPATTPSTATPTSVPGIARATSIAAGSQHTCARLSDGTVKCWGANASGQLGDGTFSASRSTPAAVSGLVDAVTVSAGATQSCALRAGGVLSCWGANEAGQLAAGAFVDQAQPIDAVGVSRVLESSGGKQFGCAIAMVSNGSVNALHCWGLNEARVLNFTPNTFTITPGRILDPASLSVNRTERVESISAGGRHACAVAQNTVDQRVLCWGDNTSGQVGTGTATPSEDPRTTVAGAVEVAAGRAHTCVVDVADAVRCWGANNLGQLGSGNTVAALRPPDFPILSAGIGARGVAVSGGSVPTAAAAGLGHSCAVRLDGTTACWGGNDVGQLNDNTTTDHRLPATTRLALPVVAMFAGSLHTCAITTSGNPQGGIACWGSNASRRSRSEAPDGSPELTTPITNNVNTLSDTFRTGAAGESHSCFVEQGNEVLCIGSNASLQLGVAVAGLQPGGTIAGNTIAAAAGASHTCLLDIRGTVRCAGSNDKGQLGIGSLLPGPVGFNSVTGLSGVVALAASGDHSCALLSNGRVACWGDNSRGQVDGTAAANRPAPVLVPAVAVGDAAGVAVGGAHSCILAANGQVRCWGANARGQLGDQSTTDRATPTIVQMFAPVVINGTTFNVTGLTNVVGLAAGIAHNCALRTTGAPVCWGANGRGQLGDNTLVDKAFGVAPASFTANIGKIATLDARERELTVTALLDCQAGARFFVEITVTQGGVTGRGQATGNCTGRLEGYPLEIEARGRDGFALGAAQGSAQIVVRDGRLVVDEQTWTRSITVVATPAGGSHDGHEDD